MRANMTTGTHEKKQADNQTNKKRAETWPGGTVVDARVALEARQTQHAHLRSSAGRRALLAAPRDRLEQLLNLLGCSVGGGASVPRQTGTTTCSGTSRTMSITT